MLIMLVASVLYDVVVHGSVHRSEPGRVDDPGGSIRASASDGWLGTDMGVDALARWLGGWLESGSRRLFLLRGRVVKVRACQWHASWRNPSDLLLGKVSIIGSKVNLGIGPRVILFTRGLRPGFFGLGRWLGVSTLLSVASGTLLLSLVLLLACFVEARVRIG